jgi:hypothetical protein
MLGPKGPFCQSCGMPLSKDPIGGGKNADGSTNPDYCSYCFMQGKFTEPNITLPEMQEKVLVMMKKDMHLPRFIGKMFTKNMLELKRWQVR